VIHIPANIIDKADVLIGSADRISNKPTKIFHEPRMNFLSELSRRLLGMPQIRDLPDVATFAYWCRRANILKLSANYSDKQFLNMGLGLTFHICPANVPVNFAFSMAFGLLSGNTCVLRLPSKETPADALLVEAIRDQIEASDGGGVGQALMLMRFERNDDVNRFWMSLADGRVIWGGDETVKYMRTFPTKARSREVSFSDRYSICIIEPCSILRMSGNEINQFCEALYKDIYLMDQFACSSPQLIAWVGKSHDVLSAQHKLWPIFVEYASKKYSLEPIQAMDKYVEACQLAVENQHIKKIIRHKNMLYRVGLDRIVTHQEEFRGHFGIVHEVAISELDQIASVITEAYQTLTVQGIDGDRLKDFITHHQLRGIDRIVPVGQALDMGILWDGYDIIKSLSRNIVIS
jgi:hypothetical protein